MNQVCIYHRKFSKNRHIPKRFTLLVYFFLYLKGKDTETSTY